MIGVAAGWIALAAVVQAGPDGAVLTVDGMEGRVHERWVGVARPVTDPVKEGDQALQWAGEGTLATSHIPHDWSAFDRLEMWMHSAQAGNAVIAVVLVSDREDTLPEDYFIAHIPIDWEGWRKLELPFRAFGRVGAPAGFGKIDSMAFHATGWQTVQRPGTVLTIDAIALRARAPGEELIISDMEEDIDAWDGLFPDVGFVKQGKQSGAWVDTVAQTSVRTENVPPDWSDYEYLCFWMHSQVANGAHIVVIIYSDNPATEGDDYWRALLHINWQGWRRVVLPLGRMHVVREPAWDNVTTLRFVGDGWDVEAQSDTELRIDDVRLTRVAPEGTLPASGLIDDFEASVSLWTGLVPDAQRAETGNCGGRWGDVSKTASIRLDRPRLRDWTPYSFLCFWLHSEVANDAEIALQVMSDNPKTEGDDYWIAKVRVGWEGWRQIGVPLRAMDRSGTPAGWDRLTKLRFLSRGWGIEPKEDTALSLDDVRLTTEAPEEAVREAGLIDDFEGPLHLWESEIALDENRPHSGRFCGRWSDLSKYPGLELGRTPTGDWSAYERLELWARAEAPQPPQFDIKVYSDSEETADRDYWRSGDLTVPVGEWKRLTVPLSYMRARGAPQGWDKVDGLELAPRGSTGRAGGEIWIDDVRVCKPALHLADEGIRRIGPGAVRWEVRLENRGEDVIVVRLQLEQPPVAGLTVKLPEADAISLKAGAEEIVAVEATLTDDLLREPLRLSGQQVAVTAVPVVGTESADLTYPALAFYFGSLEPGPHPWLFFAEGDLPALRDKMEHPTLAYAWNWYQKARGPDRTHVLARDQTQWERSVHTVMWALDGLAFLHRLSGEQSYLEAAKRNIATILSAPSWVSPAQREKGLRVDPLSSNVGRVLASAYDWLCDELTQDEQRAIRGALAQRLIEPALIALESGGSYAGSKVDHNWCGIVHGSAGVAALALLGKDPRAPAWTARMLEQLQQMLDAGGRDGGWTEGPVYWEYGFSFAFQFMDALRRVTGGSVDLFEHPFCKATGAFGLYTRLSNFDAVTFGDARRRQYDRSVLAKLAAELGSSELQWAAFNRRSSLLHPFTFIWYDPEVAAHPPRDWPLSKHFRGIEWVFLRTGWEPDATVFALRSGRRDTHSHLDANSFVLEAFGQPMIIDVGRGTYGPGYFSQKTRWNDVATRTESHNTILINGANQIPGEDGGHIAKFSTSEAFDYVLADATRTYEGGKKVLRHVLFVRPAYFVIYDEVETEEPAEVAFSLYRERNGTERELGNGGVVYGWEKGSLLVRVLQPAGASLQPAGEVKQHPCERLTHPEHTRRCDFLVLLYPLPAGEDVAFPSIATTREGADILVQIERPGATDTIRIRPTQPAATIEAGSTSEDGRAERFSSQMVAEVAARDKP